MRRPLSAEVGEDGFNTTGDVELLIDVVEVRFHCVQREAEAVGNLLVAPPGRGIGQDFPLSLRQMCQRFGIRLMSVFDCGNSSEREPVRHERREHVLALVGRTNDP